MYVIEEIHPITRKVIRIIAAVENAAVGKAVYEAACARDAAAFIVLRSNEKIISQRKED